MAPRDSVSPADPSLLGLRERGRARRRVRYLRRLRELQLRDLGGLVFDLYRFGEQRDALVRGKLDALIATDKEIGALETVLGERRRELEVRQPGLGGTCANCGAFHASDARFCATCGLELAVTAPTEAAEPDELTPTEEAEAAAAAEEEMPEADEEEITVTWPEPDGASVNGPVEEAPTTRVPAVAASEKSGRRRKR